MNNFSVEYPPRHQLPPPHVSTLQQPALDLNTPHSSHALLQVNLLAVWEWRLMLLINRTYCYCYWVVLSCIFKKKTQKFKERLIKPLSFFSFSTISHINNLLTKFDTWNVSFFILNISSIDIYNHLFAE